MKKTIKLRDMTFDQFGDYAKHQCGQHCQNCPLNFVCNAYHSWTEHKKSFTNEFLDQTVEIEVPDLLTEEEKTLLKKVLIVIGKEYVDTFWVDWVNGIKCITWGYFGHRGSKGEAGIILSRFPVKDSDFSNLEKGVYYNKEELGLEGQ